MRELWLDSSDGFNPDSTADYLPEPQLRDLQRRRLRSVVGWAFRKVALFEERMEVHDVKPHNIRSLEDIQRLPFTQRADLRESYPYGMFAVPIDQIVRLHASSDTGSKPIAVAYTPEDMQLWSGLMLRTFAACGLHRGDIIQNAYGYGMSSGGLGANYGAEALGATVIPASGNNTDRQIMLMQDFGVTAVCATPSYFLHLLDRAEEMGLSLRDLPLRAGVFGGEHWTDPMREHIEEAAGIEAFDIYGLSEIIGPGVASECECRDGLHLFEDHFYPEIIDPETGKTLPEGEEGELVLTTLTRRAMPLIRYRTHEVTRLLTGSCECGRSLRRIQRICRRTDDMLTVGGVHLFPSQVESALLQVEGTLPHYRIILTRQEGLEEMEVQVEVTRDVFSDKIRTMESLERRLGRAVENATGVRANIRLVQPQTLERSLGRAERVVDKR